LKKFSVAVVLALASWTPLADGQMAGTGATVRIGTNAPTGAAPVGNTHTPPLATPNYYLPPNYTVPNYPPITDLDFVLGPIHGGNPDPGSIVIVPPHPHPVYVIVLPPYNKIEQILYYNATPPIYRSPSRVGVAAYGY